MSVSVDPKSPPALLLVAKHEDKVESEIIPLEAATPAEIILVDPAVVKVLKSLPYQIPRHVESKLLSNLQTAWSAISDADKVKMASIFTSLGVNKQVSLRLRNIVNEITEDGKIDMEDLPHITDLIVTLLEIFEDMKLPPKSDALIVPVFEFLVMIIVASSIQDAEDLDKWVLIIKSAMRLVKLQVRAQKGCCACF